MTWILRFWLNFLPNSWPKPAKTFKKAEDFEDFQGDGAILVGYL